VASGRAEDQPPRGTVRHWREREQPEPSAVWQTVAIVFAGFGFSAAIGALTIPQDAMRSADLWLGAAAFAALAIACFLAHWDVNRGRKSRRYEIEERQ
jgi:hypothetical protein